MTAWLERDTFTAQFAAADSNTGLNAKAPCPSDYGQGQSYWIEEHPIDFEEECRQAAIPEDVDVVIIGTGITGATAAYQLSRQAPNLRVTMFDARGICSGATGRNGGHIARAEAVDFRKMAEKFGTEDSVRLRELITKNRDMMLEAIDVIGGADAVDLKLTGSFAVFASQKEREEYMADEEACVKAGMRHEGRVIDADELLQKVHMQPQMATYGAAYLEKAGTIYPRKLVDRLLRYARSHMTGLSIHPSTPVRSVTLNDKCDGSASAFQYSVATDKGDVRARAVFHATNAYASYLIPSLQGQNGVFGCKAEVLAIQPNCPAAPEHGLESSFGYDELWHWAMQRPHNGPFIYGWSELERLGDYDDSRTAANEHGANRAMKEWLEQSFPNCFKDVAWERDLCYRWSGIQGLTKDGASVVGRPSPESPGEFLSVGHNGEGMGRCFASATVVADAILHHLAEKPWTAPSWFPKAFLRNI